MTKKALTAKKNWKRVSATAGLCLGLAAGTTLWAQESAPAADAKEKVVGGYTVHQTVELGGHYADHSGSGQMWSTLVNLQSGPRILNYSLSLRTAPGKSTPLFDDLSTSNSGYGGDPNNVTFLRIAKGKWYQFDGQFRRNRQYFDYNLLDNPLIPSGGNPYSPALSSPHRFNTVRRNTDTNATILPLSAISFRVGYAHGTMEGPSFSNYHAGAEALLYQWWRNSTDTWTGGVDWKVTKQTTLSYDQFFVHYKGDTNWRLTGYTFGWSPAALEYQITGGKRVSTGIDIFPANSSPCASMVTNGTTTPVTINSSCNGYFAYNRVAPTRTSFPSEQFRFMSSSIKNVVINGRIHYSDATGSVNHYSELFDGLTTRTATRQTIDQGIGANSHLASMGRISVSGDLGVVAEITSRLSVTDSFSFWNFRTPAQNIYAENNYFGANLTITPNQFAAASCPAPYNAATCPYHTSSSGADLAHYGNSNKLGQDTKANTFVVSYQLTPKAKLSAGYRYRTRDITQMDFSTSTSTYLPGLPSATTAKPGIRGGCTTATAATDGSCTVNATTYDTDTTTIDEHWALFGAVLEPTNALRLNINFDTMSADKGYTRISPRHIDNLRVRGTYKVRQWWMVNGSVSDYEASNTTYLVGHKEHARDVAFGTSVTPNDKVSFDLNYGYNNVFSLTNECYTATPVPTGAVTTAPTCTITGATVGLFSNGYYDQPVHSGSFNLNLTPVKRVHTNLGYQVTDNSGKSEMLNARMVYGSLRSRYQTPYANLALDIAPQWSWKAGWNYTNYGEQGPTGPTLPRNFHGNVLTMSVRHAF